MTAHERTGYPLLEQTDEESVVRVLAGEAPVATCATCAWCRGGYWGAPFDDGSESKWMDARCDRRFIEMMDAEYERDVDAGHYSHLHRQDAACGAGTRIGERWVQRWARHVEVRDPEPWDTHDRWWHENYPRFTTRKPDYPACIHWRSRDLPPPTIRDAWVELDQERAA